MSETVTIKISKAANRWLANGERGISSESIFSHLTGLSVVGRWGIGTPSDPSDLRRCRLLLKAVPEFRKRFQEMRQASKRWAIAVDHWDELCALFDEEAPNWATRECWVAPRTFKRMKEVGL